MADKKDLDYNKSSNHLKNEAKWLGENSNSKEADKLYEDATKYGKVHLKGKDGTNLTLIHEDGKYTLRKRNE